MSPRSCNSHHSLTIVVRDKARLGALVLVVLGVDRILE